MPQSERSMSHVSARQFNRAMRKISRVSGNIIQVRGDRPR